MEMSGKIKSLAVQPWEACHEWWDAASQWWEGACTKPPEEKFSPDLPPKMNVETWHLYII